MKPILCPDCGIEMVRRKSKFKRGYWWGCKNFPKCTITCSEHPDGTIMSLPADKETKELRNKAHKLSEIIWGKWETADRTAMYAWLSTNSRTGHIGTTNKSELKELIKKLRKEAKHKIKKRGII